MFPTRWTPSSSALLIFRTKGTTVHLNPVLVLPTLQTKEIDLSLKTITIERRGTSGLRCKDNIRVHVVAHFQLRINPSKNDILQVATAIGCEQAGQQETLEALFAAKFAEALQIVSKRFDFEELLTHREDFQAYTIQTIGPDLNGFILEDVIIETLDQVPLEELDPNDILDAEGIEKITEITVYRQRRTLALQEEREQVTQRHQQALQAVKQLEAKQASLEATITLLEQKIAELRSVIAEKRPTGSHLDDDLHSLLAGQEADQDPLD